MPGARLCGSYSKLPGTYAADELSDSVGIPSYEGPTVAEVQTKIIMSHVPIGQSPAASADGVLPSYADKIAKIASVDFEVLDAAGKNYLSWHVDLKFHLRAQGLLATISTPAPPAPATVTGNAVNNAEVATTVIVSDIDKAKAIIYIRRHIDRTLKAEYLTVEDPKELWTALEDRYKHQKDVILPRARYEWENLRLQDFKSVAEYNSALHNITSCLKLCGEEVSEERMLEKTYTSFHEKDAILMQQYRERKFKKYSELHSTLLMAEQNRELLLATHNLRPARCPPQKNNPPQSSNSEGKKKWKKKTTELSSIPKNTWEDKCHRCGMTGHWSRNCRTPRHLQDLYLASQKSPVETNLVEKQPSTQFTADDFEMDDLLD
ncbi:uncharacterized protein LOC109823435 [Asparagus officinalis]|uniref:uncharacterized protein LOC109823435 n=1 Tax=Asparagus officinalis TaxID=4686 RepID=UPI00098DFA27|nr:uncharacterized protein LOC109823435 [Asparagus officinalis]